MFRGQATSLFGLSGPDPRISMAPNYNLIKIISRPDSGDTTVLLASANSDTPSQTLSATTCKTQFTNLRTRTLFTRPSIKNVDQMLDPP